LAQGKCPDQWCTSWKNGKRRIIGVAPEWLRGKPGEQSPERVSFKIPRNEKNKSQKSRPPKARRMHPAIKGLEAGAHIDQRRSSEENQSPRMRGRAGHIYY